MQDKNREEIHEIEILDMNGVFPRKKVSSRKKDTERRAAQRIALEKKSAAKKAAIEKAARKKAEAEQKALDRELQKRAAEERLAKEQAARELEEVKALAAKEAEAQADQDEEIEFLDDPVDQDEEIEFLDDPVDQDEEIEFLDDPVDQDEEIEFLDDSVDQDEEIKFLDDPVDQDEEIVFLDEPVQQDAANIREENTSKHGKLLESLLTDSAEKRKAVDFAAAKANAQGRLLDWKEDAAERRYQRQEEAEMRHLQRLEAAETRRLEKAREAEARRIQKAEEAEARRIQRAEEAEARRIQKAEEAEARRIQKAEEEKTRRLQRAREDGQRGRSLAAFQRYEGAERKGRSIPKRPVASKRTTMPKRPTAVAIPREGRFILPIWLIVVIIIAAAYIGTSIYFVGHFYSRGTVFGIEMFGETKESLEEQIVAKINDYSLNIETRNGEEVIKANEVDLAYVDDGLVAGLLKSQNPFLWPIGILQSSPEDDTMIEISYSEGLLVENLSASAMYDDSYVFEPTDAYISYGDGEFEIVPEDKGTLLDEYETTALVGDALSNGLTKVNLDENNCYVDPEVTSDDETLQQECAAMNNLLNVNLTMNFGDRTEIIDADVLQAWVIENEDGTFSLNDEDIEQYVEDLADKYDTLDKERTFTTFYGNEVTFTGGDYGWKMNQHDTLENILEAIAEGGEGEVEIVYDQMARSRNENDLGDTYVEVSIDDQQMWLWKDGEVLVDTPIVTGSVARNTETPRGGVWSIKYKQSPAVLGSLERTGYESHVTYWMPFNHGVGIHDADGWRAYYGGDIYKYSGSHGCVNTPRANVKIIYENVEAGVPVVVY